MNNGNNASRKRKLSENVDESVNEVYENQKKVYFIEDKKEEIKFIDDTISELYENIESTYFTQEESENIKKIDQLLEVNQELEEEDILCLKFEKLFIYASSYTHFFDRESKNPIVVESDQSIEYEQEQLEPQLYSLLKKEQELLQQNQEMELLITEKKFELSKTLIEYCTMILQSTSSKPETKVSNFNIEQQRKMYHSSDII
jgi:hypothetical protein